MAYLFLVRPMSAAKLAVLLISAAAVAGCAGTAESNSWLNGVSREEAAEIRTAIRSHTSAPVHSYLRLEDGSIDVSTEGEGIWNARKIRGKWYFRHEIVVI
jgi:hypothetical protein